MKKYLFLLTVITLLGLWAQAQVAPLKFETDLFEITGPANWEMQSDPDSWMPVKFIRGDAKTPGLRESINVSYANKNETMATFTNGLATQVNDFRIIEEGEGKIDGLPAQYTIFTYNYNGIILKSKTWLVMIPDKLGLYIGYMASEQSYPKYYKLFEETLVSVKLYQ